MVLIIVAGSKSNFLDKVLGRIGRLHAEGLQTVVQRLARERAFLESLFNAIEDGVLVLDEAGRIVYFNRAVTQLLGLPEGAENQPVMRFVPELDWARLSDSADAGPGRVVRHELEVSYPRARFLSFYVTPLDGEHAGSAGLALVIHDVTEARARTFAAVESERLHALTLLAASVAHEIGNPLNALHIHMQLMERELRKLRSVIERLPKSRPRFGRRKTDAEPPELEAAEIHAKLEKFTAVAKGEIVRLDSIVTQFLQAIRPSPPQVQLASLNTVVTETIELLRPEIDNRAIRVHQRLAAKLPVSRIDPGQIKQALVNLVRNAIQAMTRGGELTIETGQRSDGIHVSVSDTGRGIPEEEAQRIFEPFFTTKKKGSGLGLMIVQRIVRDHGGQMELESRVGQGTTFRIWLPLHERKPRLLSAGERPHQEGEG